MTTIHTVNVKCALCGSVIEAISISSIYIRGFPDLDTRPSEMERSTICWWIQACPSCGYCAPRISQFIEKASELIQTPSYKSQLNNPEFPSLANKFLCYSLIQEHNGKYADAAWACIHAAWVCDDERYEIGSLKCRKKAIELLEKARENRIKYAKDKWTEITIMVDLLRRSGQFESALKVCEEGLKSRPEGIVSKILNFQKKLINDLDLSCHSVSEITTGNESKVENSSHYSSKSNSNKIKVLPKIFSPWKWFNKKKKS